MALTDDLSTFDVKELQKELKARGVKLHLEEVGL
jgi:predicted HTH domain antitoxin